MNPHPEMAAFDFKRPDYLPIINARIARLSHIRQHPELLPALDWGIRGM